MAALARSLDWKRYLAGLAILLLWFISSWVGGFLYALPVGAVHFVLGLDRLSSLDQVAELADWMQVLSGVLCGAAMGLSIGLAQWLVLRREIKPIRQWIVATIAGYASIGLLPVLVGMLFPSWSDWAYTLVIFGKMQWLARLTTEWPEASWLPGQITLTLLGITLGLAQWLVLRRHVHRAGWWIALSACGWALGALLSNIPNAFLSVSASYDTTILVTGAGMAWLLEQKRDPPVLVPKGPTCS